MHPGGPGYVPGSPIPGSRPTLGGPGHMVQPQGGLRSSGMGIFMPLYTIGIVIFFVYTILKVSSGNQFII